MSCDCGGSGYRTVTDGYVDRLCPELPDDAPEHAKAQNRAQRSALANSCFPCPTCQPDLFLRWKDGDWPTPKAERRQVSVPDRERRDLE